MKSINNFVCEGTWFSVILNAIVGNLLIGRNAINLSWSDPTLFIIHFDMCNKCIKQKTISLHFLGPLLAQFSDIAYFTKAQN